MRGWKKWGKGPSAKWGSTPHPLGSGPPALASLPAVKRIPRRGSPFVVEFGVLPLVLLPFPSNPFLLLRFSSLFLFVGMAKTGRNLFEVWTLTPRVYYGDRIADHPGSRKGIGDTSWCYGCQSAAPVGRFVLGLHQVRSWDPVGYGMHERSEEARY